MHDRPAHNDEMEEDIEITDEMLAEGEEAALGMIGGAMDLGGGFSARELALEVYRAMEAQRRTMRAS